VWAICKYLNPFTPNDHYSGRTAPLTSKRCILYIYSTNTDTEYFKHDIYSPIFYLQNAVSFMILTYLVPVLFTFYVQGVLKLKKNNSGAKRLILQQLAQLLTAELQAINFTFTANRTPLKTTQQTKVNKTVNCALYSLPFS